MMYHQLTTDERYTIASLRMQRASQAEIARYLNRSPSTISRELKRNASNDGGYRSKKAVNRTPRVRRESPRKWYFNEQELQMDIALLRLDWSPEQISLWLKKYKIFSISHTTIYRYVWYDYFFRGKL